MCGHLQISTPIAKLFFDPEMKIAVSIVTFDSLEVDKDFRLIHKQQKNINKYLREACESN